ncbi:MAG: PQQ-binding-like beta-propeller repeat protein [Thermodesulfobacteriota bacterium]
MSGHAARSATGRLIRGIRAGGAALGALLLALGAPGCASLSGEREAAEAPRPPAPAWAMEGGDPGRASRAPALVRPEWRPHALIPLRERMGYHPEEYATPLLIGNVAYVGHSGRAFEALRLDGTRVWSFPTGGRVYGTAAYAGGLLVFGDDQGTVRALDLAGREVWTFAAGYPVVSSPLAAGDRVYVPVADQNVFCLEAATGRPLWQYGRRFPRRDSLWRSLGLAFGDGRVYAGFADGSVVALEADLGRVVWRAEVGVPALFGDVAAGPSFRDGRVYAGVFRGPVVCLDAGTGAEVWRQPVEAAAGFALGDERLYVGTAGGGLAALALADGAVLWEAPLDGGAPTAPVLAGETIVVGASEGSLLGIDAASGAVRARFAPGTGLHGQPLVFEHGVVFLSDGGALHVLR